jgi:hypothetical protein
VPAPFLWSTAAAQSGSLRLASHCAQLSCHVVSGQYGGTASHAWGETSPAQPGTRAGSSSRKAPPSQSANTARARAGSGQLLQCLYRLIPLAPKRLRFAPEFGSGGGLCGRRLSHCLCSFPRAFQRLRISVTRAFWMGGGTVGGLISVSTEAMRASRRTR